jgi:hypothetical protein
MLQQPITITAVVAVNSPATQWDITVFFQSPTLSNYLRVGDLITDKNGAQFNVDTWDGLLASPDSDFVSGGDIRVSSLDSPISAPDTDTFSFLATVETPGQIDVRPAVRTNGSINTSNLLAGRDFQYSVTCTWAIPTAAQASVPGDRLTDLSGKTYTIISKDDAFFASGVIEEVEKEGNSPNVGNATLYRSTANFDLYQGTELDDPGRTFAFNRDAFVIDNNLGSGGGAVDDGVYPTGWDGDTTQSASRNALFDKFDLVDTEISGNTASIIADPFKPSVRVTTPTVDVVLSGLQSLSGVSLVDGDRVLLVAQNTVGDPVTTDPENGPWIVRSGAWERPEDYNAAIDLPFGAVYLVREGTNGFAGRFIQLLTTGTIIPDTTPTLFGLAPIGTPADTVGYDNSTSGLAADEVQAALDEIEARVDANDAKVSADGSVTTHSDVTSIGGSNDLLVNEGGSLVPWCPPMQKILQDDFEAGDDDWDTIVYPGATGTISVVGEVLELTKTDATLATFSIAKSTYDDSKRPATMGKQFFSVEILADPALATGVYAEDDFATLGIAIIPTDGAGTLDTSAAPIISALKFSRNAVSPGDLDVAFEFGVVGGTQGVNYNLSPELFTYGSLGNPPLEIGLLIHAVGGLPFVSPVDLILSQWARLPGSEVWEYFGSLPPIDITTLGGGAWVDGFAPILYVRQESVSSPITAVTGLTQKFDKVRSSQILDTGASAPTDNVGYDEIFDESSPLTKRGIIKFTGTGVVASDGTGPDSDKTLVTIDTPISSAISYTADKEDWEKLLSSLTPYGGPSTVKSAVDILNLEAGRVRDTLFYAADTVPDTLVTLAKGVRVEYKTNVIISQGTGTGSLTDGGSSATVTTVADSAGSPGSRILVTTSAPHGFVEGQFIEHSGMGESTYNGFFRIVVQAASTTYEIEVAFVATDTGTARPCDTFSVTGTNLNGIVSGDKITLTSGTQQGTYTVVGGQTDIQTVAIEENLTTEASLNWILRRTGWSYSRAHTHKASNNAASIITTGNADVDAAPVDSTSAGISWNVVIRDNVAGTAVRFTVDTVLDNANNVDFGVDRIVGDFVDYTVAVTYDTGNLELNITNDGANTILVYATRNEVHL